MKIIVNKDNVRIDTFLAPELNLSRSKVQKMIQNGAIKVNNKVVKNNYEVNEKDEITISEINEKDESLKPKKMSLDFVYEDDYLMVVNKPKGLVVHPGAGGENNTLVNGLLFYGKNLSQVDAKRPGIIHRLDADTSGLLLVAKTDDVHLKLANDFKSKKIKRQYIALVWGVIKNQSGTIDAPIGRDSKNRQRYTVSNLNSKRAVTHFKVLTRYEKTTLLEITLETGRTHQIRVHMQYIGFPVVNDPVYSHYDKIDDSGQCLHAKELTFNHPILKKEMSFTIEPPLSFNKLLDLCAGGDKNASNKNEN